MAKVLIEYFNKKVKKAIILDGKSNMFCFLSLIVYYYKKYKYYGRDYVSIKLEISHRKNDVASIGDDLILLDRPIIQSRFNYPFKVDVTTAHICLSGWAEGFINLKKHISEAPSLTILLPGQILQHKHVSEDHSGLYIIMSQEFINNLNMQQTSSLFYSIRDNPTISLNDMELKSIITYHTMLKEAILNVENPYRMDTVKYLTKAFFYGTSYNFHKKLGDKNQSKHEMLFNKFSVLVQEYYKQERNVGFYADKLCLTPKYLSAVIKENTNKSANDWIDSYVILEAKALLKSTNMTIQQISEKLNFPSQSFFGKYFKRLTDMSPRDYKKMP